MLAYSNIVKETQKGINGELHVATLQFLTPEFGFHTKALGLLQPHF